MSVPIMKCGHSANGRDSHGNPVCLICLGINEGATVVDNDPPNLKGRMAKCSYCRTTRPSSPTLPFFAHKPDQELDQFYCGCFGWN